MQFVLSLNFFNILYRYYRMVTDRETVEETMGLGT